MEIKIIAHRGSNKKAPQNTMPAFVLADRDNADGYETDVHLTRDGIPVICHNYTVDMTSDCTGNISDFTLAELKKMDFGSYFSEEYKGTPLPTLDEFLAFAAESGREVINIELKCPREGMQALVGKTVEAIAKYGISDKIIISSFSPKILKKTKAAAPGLKTAFLYPTNRPSVCRPVLFNPFLIAKRVGADYLHPAAFSVTPALVKLAHRLGLKVNVWTVDDEPTVRRLMLCGVDGIITDCPDLVRGYIDKKRNGRKKGAENGREP